MVDLGLSSGTKWAARNLGATSVEDYGHYYAWGEVETKDSYTQSNYKYGTQNLGNNYDISGTQNDAAVVNWGGIWRMPNYTEMTHLKDSCQWEWNSINGVNGYIVTGKNGNKIFLPAAGYIDGTSPAWAGSGGVYMTSIQTADLSSFAHVLCFHSSGKGMFSDNTYYHLLNHYDPAAYRYVGHTVRAVSAPNVVTEDGNVLNIVTDSCTWKLGDTQAALFGTLSSVKPFKGTITVGFVVGDSATITYDNARFKLEKEVSVGGSFTMSQSVYDNIGYWYRAFVVTGDTIFYGTALHYGYEMVDLGLKSGVKWANMNLGADSPEDTGNYYAWGEVKTQDSYTSANYLYGTSNLGEDYDIAGTDNDAVHVNMGNAWQMPNYQQMKELSDSCTWVWTSQNSVTGYRVTGPNGNSIFLPAAGYVNDTSNPWLSSGGVYMTSSQAGDISSFAHVLCFRSSGRGMYSDNTYYHLLNHYDPAAYRFIGHTVRAVAVPNGVTTGDLVLNVRTDSATWAWGDNEVTLHGTLSSTTPINKDITVGFIIGYNDSIVKTTATAVYPQTKNNAGKFTQVLPVHDNIGYWYRAYIETTDTIFFGKTRHYGLEIVDLGLPSGTRWSNMNVGASHPEDYGNYYAWGETSVKDSYTSDNYLYGTLNLGEHCDISGTDHDAAHVNMGNAWRMPTSTQLTELKDNCTWTWTSQGNVTGYRVTGPNGNSIFMPAAGYKNETSTPWLTSGGVYLGSNESGFYNQYSYILVYTSGSRNIQTDNSYYHILGHYDISANRYIGHTVRPVYAPNAVTQNATMNILTDSATWEVGQTEAVIYGTISSMTPLAEGTKFGFIVGDAPNIEHNSATTVYVQGTTGYGQFSQVITGIQNNMGYWYRAYIETPDGDLFYGTAKHFGWEKVDLGLPSGTLWSNVNVDASWPEQYGSYYAWGETNTKQSYTSGNYLYGTQTLGDNGDITATLYDASFVNMGSYWCCPTSTQLSELSNNCTWTWTSHNDVTGYRVESSNGRYIFLPATGYMSGESCVNAGSWGTYSSANMNTGDANHAYSLCYHSSSSSVVGDAGYYHIFGHHNDACKRYMGHTIRAVAR